jgi:hypothetical protein
VIALQGDLSDYRGKNLQVLLATPGESRVIGSAPFAPFGLGARLQATLQWFWDTTGLDPGEYELTFSIEPGGERWQETVTLLPAKDLPPLDAGARWLTSDSQCCQFHYLSGTAAERDLAALKEMADEQASAIEAKLQVQPDEKIPVVFLPRVLGHGGFTAQEIAVSYLDRNYAGDGSEMVLHHEMVHWLDGKLGGDLRPSLLVEGLAVSLTGGHFKPEPLIPRAAALLPPVTSCLPASLWHGQELDSADPRRHPPACGLDRYIPLAELADNFYPSQHEIGYLQAGALVDYMVQTWGWPAFNDFYRDIHPLDSTSTTNRRTPTGDSLAIDAALKQHFNLDLAQLEQNFIAFLSQQALTSDLVEDVRLSIAYFDTLRRYQQWFDPSAYFLYAWLADPVQARQRGITADYLRHPQGPDNVLLEDMFVEADAALRAGDLFRTEQVLRAINRYLDNLQTRPHETALRKLLN